MPHNKATGKVFRDPVHQLIQVAPEDRFVVDLIDTPEFQRLRRIRQLGVSWLTYHGAEHSRFVHSIGVFNFAQKIIASLMARYRDDKEIRETLETHRRTVLAAALLHDVGHGPFSHLLERAFGKKKHHEEIAVEIINSDDTSINKVLKRHGLNPAAVAAIIRKDFPTKFLVDVVSGQLDADRMDYLLRDSYCTGVGYGEYDPNWILHAMCLGCITDRDGTANLKLCLDRTKGVYAAERFVIARLHMYQQVYMHRVTRGFEVLLLNLFTAASHRKLPSGTPPVVKRFIENRGEISLSDFLTLDEAQMTAAFGVWAQSPFDKHATIRRLASAILCRKKIYAAVNLQELKAQQKYQLQSAIEKVPKEADRKTPRYGIDTVEDQPYKGMLYTARTDHDPEEIVNESILVSVPDMSEHARPAETESKILSQMSVDKFAIERLYFDRELSAEFKAAADEHGIGLPITIKEQP